MLLSGAARPARLGLTWPRLRASLVPGPSLARTDKPGAPRACPARELPAGPLPALPHPPPARPTWPNFLSLKGEVWERPGRGRWTHMPGHGAWPGPPPKSSCTQGLGCRGRPRGGGGFTAGAGFSQTPPRACPGKPPDHHPDRAPLLPTRLNATHFVPTSRLNNLRPTAKRVRGARGWASGNIRNDHRVRGSHLLSSVGMHTSHTSWGTI